MFLSIVSGSSGNAELIKNDDTTILIDCGASGKRLTQLLEGVGINMNKIAAILITHEHCDHIQGAGIISRRYNVPIYATCGTYNNMNIGKLSEENIKIIEPDSDFEIGGILVHSFSLSHDAAEPVGYTFSFGGKKYAIATDTGILTDTVFDAVSGSECIMLEANHDVDMLMHGEYPYELKKRILSDSGHLSNIHAAQAAVRFYKDGARRIMLSHLSDKNNNPDVAYLTVAAELEKNGINVGQDMLLNVAKRYEVTELI